MPEHVDVRSATDKIRQTLKGKVPDSVIEDVEEKLRAIEKTAGTAAFNPEKVEHGTVKLPARELIMALGLHQNWVPYAAWVNPEDGAAYLTARKDTDRTNPLPIDVGDGRIIVAADIPVEQLHELAENIMQFMYTKDIKALIGVYGEAGKAMTILKQE